MEGGDTSTVDESTQVRRQVENASRAITEYKLERIIGTGTFGKVYLANLDGKGYAVKILHKKKIIELK